MPNAPLWQQVNQPSGRANVRRRDAPSTLLGPPVTWLFAQLQRLLARIALALAPESARLRAVLGRAHAELGDDALAAAYLEGALERDTSLGGAWLSLGHIHARRRQPVRAATCYERARQLGLTGADLPFALANVLYEQGAVAEALDLYHLAVAVEPTHSQSWFNLGHALKARDQLHAAEAAFAAAVRSDPRFFKARFMRAHVLSLLGRSLEAVSEYHETLRYSPTYVKAHYNLGSHHLKEGEFEGAVKRFRRVLHLDPNYDRAHHALGQAYAAMGRFTDAREALTHAIRLRVGNHSARLQLARVLDELGLGAEAAVHYRQWLRDSPPPHPTADTALAEQDSVKRRLQELARPN